MIAVNCSDVPARRNLFDERPTSGEIWYNVRALTVGNLKGNMEFKEFIESRRSARKSVASKFSVAELGYDRPDLEEYHEPDQTVLTVYLKTSTKSTKTSTKKTSSKSEKTREKKTREKRSADVIEPLKNKGETTKTVGKKTVGKGVETREKKTRVKSTGTREKKFDFPPEELVVLRLTAQRLIAVMRRNPRVTTAELAEELGVTDKGIEWQIVKLRKDKMIRRVGGRKFGSWEVLI